MLFPFPSGTVMLISLSFVRTTKVSFSSLVYVPRTFPDQSFTAVRPLGYIKSYTVYPGLIFGLATGRFVDAGLEDPVPSALRLVANFALQRGVFGSVGPMKNIWSLVDIHDGTCSSLSVCL